jgi:hypothetical protein
MYGRPSTAPLQAELMIDRRDLADMMDSTDKNEPMERSDTAEPTDPIDSTDPIEPTESNEPRDPMHSNESSDQSDHLALLSAPIVEELYRALIGGRRRAEGHGR